MSTIKKVSERNVESLFKLINEIDFKRDPSPFIEYLVETDFFYAPGSIMYHDSHNGGLYIHCKRVYDSLVKLNELVDNKYSKETLFYLAFGHDLCKVGTYKPKEVWYKDEKNKWQSKDGWGVVDDFPIGHGEKSLFIMNKYVKLTLDEILALRWHMGFFDVGVAIASPAKMSYSAAQDMSPLVRMILSADNMAVAISQVNQILEEESE